jgi:hypothetical protein
MSFTSGVLRPTLHMSNVPKSKHMASRKLPYSQEKLCTLLCTIYHIGMNNQGTICVPLTLVTWM